MISQPKAREKLHGAVFGLLFLHAVHFTQRKRHVFQGRHVFKEASLLKDKTDAATPAGKRPFIVTQRAAVYGHGARFQH